MMKEREHAFWGGSSTKRINQLFFRSIKMKKKLKVVTIKMSRWARTVPETGNTTTEAKTCLYNSEGKMCCLGFDARQIYKKRVPEIREMFNPTDVGITDWIIKDVLDPLGSAHSAQWTAIAINDNPAEVNIKTTAQQQTALKKLFHQMGRELRFVE